MGHDIAPEKLVGKIELADPGAFGAGDPLSANDHRRHSGIIDASNALASPAGDPLNDRQLWLARVVDDRHGPS
jgi:hypothetical protein